jgi:tetratricopeptide (TPR) repeat protein
MRDEDEDVLPQTEYAFNPIQAKKDLKIGDFYWKKGNHRAAAARYLEATRWNPTFADAYWKLGEAREKLNQPAEALDAYRKFLGAESEGKRAEEAHKRIEELEKHTEKLPVAASESDR